jgi:Cu(I)/Ag(I) efflux system membrane fusion protein
MIPTNKKLVGAGIALAIATAGAGYWIGSSNSNGQGVSKAGAGGEVDGVVQDASGKTVKYWFDPMLPQERYNAPGKSSMNMELQPKYADDAGSGEGIKVSADVRQNLGVRTARAAFANLSPTLAVVGRVEIDERRIQEVQTLTPGFVDELSVRAVGEQVSRGRRVASVYSPELLGAQNEYVALLRIGNSAITPNLRQASRRRLSLLGLPEVAIRNLDRGGRPQRNYGVIAPRSGIVTAIGARPGARVEPGQSILTIADLSQVWVVAEVPEVALAQIRVGQSVQITFPAYPEGPREGRIDYIFPTLDAQARTVRVRISLSNPGGRLKIGMFANLKISGSGSGALVVPTEAVIATGKRNVVIVERSGGLIPVEVELGREVGDRTEILRGIAANDLVVVSGQFLIDSEASLAGVVERLSRTRPETSERPRSAPSMLQGRGVIKAIDAKGQKLTLSHEPLPALGWPAMTMAFPVKNATVAQGRAIGERVVFSFPRPAKGETPVIERLQPEAAR